MKLLRNLTLITISLVTNSVLISCDTDQNSLVTPKQSPMEKSSDYSARTNGKYYITRDGENNLVYTNKGRMLLSKIKGPGGDWNVVYGWGTKQTIGLLKYGINGKSKAESQEFILNEKGQCVESITDDHYFFQYNAKDQLTKCYSKYEPNKRLEFTYETNPFFNDKCLTKVTFYDENNFKYKEISYGYVYGVPDLNQTNPDLPPFGICKYLPIFGNFNYNLLNYTSTTNFLPNGNFTYTALNYEYLMDMNGRAKKIITKKPGSKEVVSVTERNYSDHPNGL